MEPSLTFEDMRSRHFRTTDAVSFYFFISEIKEKQENMRNIFHNLSSTEKRKKVDDTTLDKNAMKCL